MVRCNVCLELCPPTAAVPVPNDDTTPSANQGQGPSPPNPDPLIQNDDNDDADDSQNAAAAQSEFKKGYWTCPTNPHHTCCFQCISLYTKTRIGDGVITVPCPGDFINCAYMLKLKELEPILPEETFAKLERMKTLASNPRARECPNCSKVCQGSSSRPRVVCSGCNIEFCFFHGNDHEGKPCSMHSATWFQQAKNKAWRWRNSRKCPQCHQAIQKAGGCQHVTCRCGYEMCWNCGCAWARNGRKGHLRKLFPAPRELKHCCNTFRIWGARVLIVSGLIIVFPIVAPFWLIYIVATSIGKLAKRKWKYIRAWKKKRRDQRKAKKNSRCDIAHHFVSGSTVCRFCGINKTNGSPVGESTPVSNHSI